MKILKYIFVVITALIIVNMMQPTVHATTQVKTFDDMHNAIQNWLKNVDTSKVDTATIGAIVNPIINLLTGIGIFVIVGVTIVMGIKYMYATPDKAAKLKEQLIGLVVSAVVVLGATAIWKIAYSIMSKVNL